MAARRTPLCPLAGDLQNPTSATFAFATKQSRSKQLEPSCRIDFWKSQGQQHLLCKFVSGREFRSSGLIPGHGAKLRVRLHHYNDRNTSGVNLNFAPWAIAGSWQRIHQLVACVHCPHLGTYCREAEGDKLKHVSRSMLAGCIACKPRGICRCSHYGGVE